MLTGSLANVDHDNQDYDVILNWKSGVSFVAEDREGHTLVLDGSPDIGGQNSGTRPMLTVLMGLAGCAAIDVVLILNKSRQNFDKLSVKVSAQRSEQIPKVFTAIQLKFVAQGTLQEKRFAQAVSLSVEKYCSVAAMLNSTAKISVSTEVIQEPH